MSACPICKKAALPRANNRFFPFCSSRCQLIDLGKWLNAEYRVPTADSGADEDDADATLGNGHSKESS